MIYECKRWWMQHRWSVWSDPRVYVDHNTPEKCIGEMQERHCGRCHAKQVRVVDRLFRARGAA